jgi:E3 ubiquitin-protein ligases UBR4 N-terminal
MSATTYAQMTAVFNEMPGALSPSKAPNLSSTTGTVLDMTTVVHASSSSSELTSGELSSTFAAMNVATLHQLGGGDALLAVCDTELIHLKRYRSCYEDELAGSSRMEACMPNSLSDAVSVRLR